MNRTTQSTASLKRCVSCWSGSNPTSRQIWLVIVPLPILHHQKFLILAAGKATLHTEYLRSPASLKVQTCRRGKTKGPHFET